MQTNISQFSQIPLFVAELPKFFKIIRIPLTVSAFLSTFSRWYLSLRPNFQYVFTVNTLLLSCTRSSVGRFVTLNIVALIPNGPSISWYICPNSSYWTNMLYIFPMIQTLTPHPNIIVFVVQCWEFHFSISFLKKNLYIRKQPRLNIIAKHMHLIVQNLWQNLIFHSDAF